MTIESVKVDLRVGGKFRTQIKMADGEFFTVAGTYLEVKTPERLVYTWDWEKDGGGTEFGELEGNESQAENREGTTGFVGITVASLDDPSEFRPQMHTWTSDAQPWDPMNPVLPRFEKYSPS